jgi:acetyltransferase-like isoleucine patch superfamily enzyme
MRALHYIKRLICRQLHSTDLHAFYTIGKNSVIHEEAEIANYLNDKSKITIGEHSHIRGQLLLFAHGGNIRIGDYCYIGKNSYIWSAKNITIGNRVLISHNCNIFDSDTHPIDAKKRHEHCKQIITTGHPRICDLNEDPVIIEDDAWIGANSIILKGLTLGKGAVVGAGSVVTADVPPFTLVAGNPARLVKKI